MIINQLPNVSTYLSGKDYLKVIDVIKEYLSSSKTVLNQIVDLSFEVWRYSEEINELKDKTSKVVAGSTDTDQDIPSKNYWMLCLDSQERNWEWFYDNGCISIGYNELNDLSKYFKKEEIEKKLQNTYDDERNYTNVTNTIYQFINEMAIGDIIYVKK